MLGFAYEIPKDFQTVSYGGRTYEKIRNNRPIVIKQIRQQHNLYRISKCGDLVLYVAINKVNNKLYVGVTKNGLDYRKAEHFSTAKRGEGGLFHKAIRKYGEEAFEFCIWSKLFIGDYQKLMFFERQLISAIMPEYNLTAGGGGVLGYKPTKETLKRLSDSHKGKKNRLGSKQSIESLQKMVATRRLRGSYKNIGKPVICVTDGKTYSSIQEAAIFYNIEIGHLGQVLKGKFKTKSVRGLYFEFASK